MILTNSSPDSRPVLAEVAKQASFGGHKMSNESNRNGNLREATKRLNMLVYQQDVGRNCSIVSVGRQGRRALTSKHETGSYNYS